MTQPVLLGDLISIKHGFAFKGQYFCDNPTSDILVTPGNFAIGGGFKQDKLKYYNGPIEKSYILQPSSVVVTMTDLSKEADTLGFSARIPEKSRYTFLHNQRIGLVALKSDAANVDYLYWVMRSEQYRNWVVSGATGSTVKHTSPSKILSYKFDLPDLETQKKIADILGTIDEKIELNRKMNETLEQMGQALFRHYFIDNPDVEKWGNGVLEDILGVTMGQSPPGSSYNTDGDGVVFYQGRAEFGKRFPEQRLSTVDPKRLAKRGDVLLSVRAPVGDINQATEDCCVGRGLAAISSSEGLESYCYYLMRYLQPRFADFNSEGTVFGAINGKQLKGLKVIIPPVELRQEFDDAAKSFDAQIWNNSHQIQTLTALRDTLLPRLINGKVKV